MRPLLKCVIASGVGIAPALAEDQAPSHCHPDEKAWFNGYAEKLDAMISLCGSQTMEDPGAWLQMRYGGLGGDVLRVPAAREGSLEAFAFSRYTRPRVTYLTLEISAEGLLYRMFDAYDADDPEATGGSLSIFFADGRETSHALKMFTEPMSLAGLDDAVPEKPFLE